MAQQPDRFQFGRTIALVGVGFVITLALLSMTLLGFGLIPQIFPTLSPTTAPTTMALTPVAKVNTMQPNQVQSSTLQSEAIQSMVENARNAWIHGNAETFASLFSNNGEFIVPGQVYRGRDEIRSVLANFAASHTDIKIDVQRIIIEDNQAVVEWRWEDTEIQTGKRTTADDAIVVDFENGEISRWREYIDERTPSKNMA